MEQVKQMVEAGARVRVAVAEALRKNGLTLGMFCVKYDLGETALRNALSGAQRASERILASLATELGGSPDDWAELLWLAGKPVKAVLNNT